MEAAPAIGIDLGTTKSCVAVLRHGKVEVIANEQGFFTTPSYVAFNDYECLIGNAAKDQAAINPENTVFDGKRMIGRKFNDPLIQNAIGNWPFSVTDVNTEPYIEVMFKGVPKSYAPVEISAMILNRMKEIAEKYLNRKVTTAVITVPAYFNNAQRQATQDAGRIAGLSVLQIVNEPTAAACAINFMNQEYFLDDIKILVYDLGGGTFDVSILNMLNKKITIMTTNSVTYMSGENCDCCLVDYCVREFKRKHNVDIRHNKRALRRLRTACEHAKRCLSFTIRKGIAVDSLAYGINFSVEISRAKFDDLNMAQFRKTLGPIQKALDDANLTKNDIHRVVLLGGATRIPRIQTLLRDFFEGKVLDVSTNPDESVAYGAAVYAAVLSGVKVFRQSISDITPFSLGYDILNPVTNNMYTCIVIPRNSLIPIIKSSSYSLILDGNQKPCQFTIRQGESRVPEYNIMVGEFLVDDLPEASAGSVEFKIVFDIDANGILTVTATEKKTKKRNSIKIRNVADYSRRDELKKMIEDAKKYHMQEQMRKIASSALKQKCCEIKNVLGDANSKCILEKCDAVLNWMAENPRASHDIYEKRQAEINALTTKLVEKIKSIFPENH